MNLKKLKLCKTRMTPKTLNDNFLKKLEEIGCKINTNLAQIDGNDMENFINSIYWEDEIWTDFESAVHPVASCSTVAANKKLKKAITDKFNLNVDTVYGYIETHEQPYHKFTKSDVRSALNENKYFNNHHTLMVLENGQILDLTFLNTLRVALNKEDDYYEFIFDSGSKIKVPLAMKLKYSLNKKSYFHFVPMYKGELFSSKLILDNSTKILG